MIVERRTTCLRFEAKDGTIIKVAPQYPVDLIMSNGEIYKGGVQASVSTHNAVLDSGANVVDLGGAYDIDYVTRAEIQSGKWENGQVYEFVTDWASPVEDDEPIAVYTMGRVKEEDDRFKLELMGIKDKLNHRLGRDHQLTCGKVFADTHLDNEPIIASDLYKCNVDPVANTVTSTITSVTNNAQFKDTARTESDDHFGNGEIIFTTGKNAGLGRRTVKKYLTDGTIVCNAPWYFTPEVGDQYKMLAGCRGRFNADCGDKWSNKINFGGKPHVPTSSQVLKIGDQN